MRCFEKPREDEATSWLWAGLWLLLIYLTIPLARSLQEVVRALGGKEAFLWITLSAFALAGWLLVRSVLLGSLRLTAGRGALLAGILGLFFVMTWGLRTNPEEALHFVQYGVLSALLFRAAGQRRADASAYLLAAAVGITAGIVDELIQWIVPRRYFDFRDIGINAIGVVLIQVAIAFGLRPDWIARRISPGGAAFALRVAAGGLALLLFCSVNTPQVKAWYASYYPGAERIDEVTAEYGYAYHDPEIGHFNSRLAPDELARQDRERAEEVGAILATYPTERHYRHFLHRYPVYSDPLLVEARVHLFRRDRYAALAIRHAADPVVMTGHSVIAHRENQILERYFPHVLHASGMRWNDEFRATAAALSEGTAPDYRSAVSSALITWTSQPVLTGLLGGLLVLVLVLERRWARRARA
jgi:hypothetical protein